MPPRSMAWELLQPEGRGRSYSSGSINVLPWLNKCEVSVERREMSDMRELGCFVQLAKLLPSVFSGC